MSLAGLVCLAGMHGLPAQTTQPTGYADVPDVLTRVQDERIGEASGIVASRLNPECYYVHNDSGDQPRIFLIDREGRTRVTIRLKGARNVDWEDIALAPGKLPGMFDVCVADIGDNSANRRNVTIYRFPEVSAVYGTGGSVEVAAVGYTARYPDGPADAEAFCVHPRTGDGYILTKRTDGRTEVYRLPAPWEAQRETTLSRVAEVELPPGFVLGRIVTAADISPDGRRVAVCCYLGGWEWQLPVGTADRDFELVFGTTPTALPLAAQRQAEGLCYSADGRAILTIVEGRRPTLYELPAALPATRPAR